MCELLGTIDGSGALYGDVPAWGNALTFMRDSLGLPVVRVATTEDGVFIYFENAEGCELGCWTPVINRLQVFAKPRLVHSSMRANKTVWTKEQPLFRCTVCGQVGTVGRCCGLGTREPLNDAARAEMERKPPANRCPICEGPAVTCCRCMRGDSVCAQGHQWHTCVPHGVVVVGSSDHALNTNTCTCGKAGKSVAAVAPSAPAVGTENNEDWWAILYEDADRKPELFTDEGSARRAFAEQLPNWNCHLFHRVDAPSFSTSVEN